MSGIILFSANNRSKFLSLTNELAHLQVELNQRILAYEASLISKRASVAEQVNERTPLIPSSDPSLFEQAVNALKSTSDPVVFEVGNKEEVIRLLKARRSANCNDQVCEGLTRVLEHEREFTDQDGSYFTSFYSIDTRGGPFKLDFLTASKNFLQLRQLQLGFAEFSQKINGLSFLQRYFNVDLTPEERAIKHHVQEMQKLLTALPVGQKVELPTYQSVKHKIQAFLKDYKGNSVMQGQVDQAITRANSAVSTATQLDELARDLIQCVDQWVHASQKNVRGSRRARLVAWTKGYTIPNQDPLFDFILRTLEFARCPMALANAARESISYASYVASHFPRKPEGLVLLDEVAAKQLLRYSREADRNQPQQLLRYSREADRNQPQLVAADVEMAMTFERSDASPRDEYIEVIAHDAVEEEQDADLQVRVLTESGLRKYNQIIDSSKDLFNELKAKLENYVLYGVGNRDKAVALLKNLTACREIPEDPRRQVEELWRFSNGFKVGVITMDNESAVDPSLLLDEHLRLNTERDVNAIYRTAKMIQLLETVHPKGKLGLSRFADIVGEALSRLNVMRLKETDFVNLEISNLSEVWRKFNANMPDEIVGDESVAKISNYFRGQLLVLQTHVKNLSRTQQRQTLSVGLARLLKNWGDARKIQGLPADLNHKVDALLKLNQKIAFLDEKDKKAVESAVQLTAEFDGKGPEPRVSAAADEPVDAKFKADDLSSLIRAHDALTVQADTISYSKRVLESKESRRLIGLVGFQRKYSDVEQGVFCFSYDDFNNCTLKKMQENLLDAGQRAIFSGDVSAIAFNKHLLELFNDQKIPGLKEQIIYIKKDPRFANVELADICCLGTSVSQAVLPRSQNQQPGVSLLGLYRALKLEKFINAEEDFPGVSFGCLSTELKGVLASCSADISSALPAKHEPTVLTYKGLVDSLLTAFIQKDSVLPDLGRDYPQLSKSVYKIILAVEQNQKLTNRSQRASKLCDSLVNLLVPYLKNHQSPNPGVMKILELVELTERPFSRSATTTGLPFADTPDFECALHAGLYAIQIKGKPVAELQLSVPQMPANEAKLLVLDVRAKEQYCDLPLNISHHERVINPEIEPALLEQFDGEVTLSGISQSSIARAADPVSEQHGLALQLINAEGNLRLEKTAANVDLWIEQAMRVCRASYTQSRADFYFRQKLWREHAFLLEVKLKDALATFDPDRDCHSVIHASPGLAYLNLKLLNEVQQQSLAKAMILRDHIQAMIGIVTKRGVGFFESEFLKGLSRIRNHLWRNVLNSSHYQIVQNVPTWLGALDRLDQLFHEMEARFNPSTYREGHKKAYQECLAETESLRFQLLRGLKAIQSNNDAGRLTALSALLVRIITEAKRKPLSVFNNKIVNELVTLNEKIARQVSSGRPGIYADMGVQVAKMALLNVSSLDRTEAKSLVHQQQTMLSSVNNAAALDNKVFKKTMVYCQDGDELKKTRAEWLQDCLVLGSVSEHLPPAQPVRGLGRYYAKNAVALRKFLKNQSEVGALLDVPRLQSWAYSRVGTHFYKRQRAFRCLAGRVAQKLEAIHDSSSLGVDPLVQRGVVCQEFLSGTNNNQQVNLSKLFAAKAVIEDAIGEIEGSGLFVKNSEYRGVLKKALKNINGHLPQMKALERAYEAFNQVKQAMQGVLENLSPGAAQGLLDLKKVIDGFDGENVSLLCRLVAKALVKLVNDVYTPGMFASKTNRHLNDPCVLGLFRVIEQVEHPVARGNPKVDGGDCSYYQFDSHYLFNRLRSQLGKAVVADAAEAEEMARVRVMSMEPS